MDPVSYGQQSTTEGSWRDVKNEVEEMKDTTQRSDEEGERFYSDLKWSVIGRKEISVSKNRCYLKIK